MVEGSTLINKDKRRPSLQLRIGHDMQYLPHRSFEFAMRSVDEVGRMIGGWSKEQEGA